MKIVLGLFIFIGLAMCIYFAKREDKFCKGQCKDCIYRSNSDYMIDELYSNLPIEKEECRYYCMKKNTYIRMEDSCNDYERN